ncbi:hypothetical protein QF001_008055 [Paraburkholderia youngii]|uniref:hypothetical protein n=1 Tax=Paraburkholderia youngii TaxID=2782701 RepID=UPI003D1E0EAE
MTPATKFDQYAAFDAASKLVKSEMAGFLQRMRAGSQLSQAKASKARGSQTGGPRRKTGGTQKG